MILGNCGQVYLLSYHEESNFRVPKTPSPVCPKNEQDIQTENDFIEYQLAKDLFEIHRPFNSREDDPVEKLNPTARWVKNTFDLAVKQLGLIESTKYDQLTSDGDKGERKRATCQNTCMSTSDELSFCRWKKFKEDILKNDEKNIPKIVREDDLDKSKFPKYGESTDDDGQHDANHNLDNVKTIQFAREFYKLIEDVVERNGGASGDSSGGKFESNFHGANNLPYTVRAVFRGQEYLFPPNCQFTNCDLLNQNTQDEYECRSVLKDGYYDLVVVDPPWRNKFVRRRKRSLPSAGYSLHEPIEILKRLGENYFPRILRAGGLVALWVTPGKESLIQDNLTLLQLKLVKKIYWLKVTRNWVPVVPFRGGQGVSSAKQPYEVLFILCHDQPVSQVNQVSPVNATEPLSTNHSPQSLTANNSQISCVTSIETFQVNPTEKPVNPPNFQTVESNPLVNFEKQANLKYPSKVIEGQINPKNSNPTDTNPVSDVTNPNNDVILLVCAPSGIHSHKPPITALLSHLLRREFENGRKCELFARYLQPGYHSLGNQVILLNHISLYRKKP